MYAFFLFGSIIISLSLSLSCPPQALLPPCSHQIEYSKCADDTHCARIQLAHLEKGSFAYCDEVGRCTCPPGQIFTGNDCAPNGIWEDAYNVLREKWHEIPTRLENYEFDRVESSGTTMEDGITLSSRQLIDLTDETLLYIWRASTPNDCFTKHYIDTFKGKKILDIGSGLARQSLLFALNGAEVTFLDIVQENLIIVERIARALNIQSHAKFLYLESLKSLADLENYDVMLAFGSLQHMPRELIELQLAEILPHLKVGGTWLQLAYPINRLFSSYTIDFTQLGTYTDGQGTQWAEWYEPGKLLKVLQADGKQKFSLVWCGIINTSEFIWFELVHTSDGNESCEYNVQLDVHLEDNWETEILNFINNS